MSDQREHATQCSTCGAEIIWVRHALTGKVAPVDAIPSPRGSLRLVPGSDGAILYEIVSLGKREPDDLLYINHFATCPNARFHRQEARQ